MRTIAVTNITNACDLVTNGRLNNSTVKDNDLIIEAYLEGKKPKKPGEFNIANTKSGARGSVKGKWQPSSFAKGTDHWKENEKDKPKEEAAGSETSDAAPHELMSQAQALDYFLQMLSTPEDSSIGDIQDAAQEAIQTGIDKDLIGGILHLPKHELAPDEIDIILNPDQNRPMN
jgi:hypothetical protein